MYIILGKNGYIAESMIKELTLRKLHFIALSRSDLDYTNFKTFSDFYNINYNSTSTPTKNSVIINCAGYVGKPNVDACELNKSDTIMGNVIFPTNLANHCSVNSSTDGNASFLRGAATARSNLFECKDNINTFEHFAENGVSSIKP